MSAPLDELHRQHETNPQPNVSRLSSVGRTAPQSAGSQPHSHLRRLALVALIEGAGYGATLVEPGQIPSLRNPAVLLVRSPGSLALVRRAPMLRNVRVVFLGDGIASRDHIRISPRSPGAESALRQALAAIVGPPDQQSTPHAPADRVRVTEREREILQTYTLGATLRETSQAHQIAESTVREHYRRVVRRYEEAGRPIGNKAQLLLEFMADGWVRP